MILKMWVKRKFVLCQPRYYNLLTEKRYKKIHLFQVLIFEELPFLWISRNSLQDDIFLGNFALSNSIILVEDLIRWKRSFEIFFIDHYPGDIRNTSIENSCVSVTHPMLGGSVHTECYICNSLVHIIYVSFICM